MPDVSPRLQGGTVALHDKVGVELNATATGKHPCFGENAILSELRAVFTAFAATNGVDITSNRKIIPQAGLQICVYIMIFAMICFYFIFVVLSGVVLGSLCDCTVAVHAASLSCSL